MEQFIESLGFRNVRIKWLYRVNKVGMICESGDFSVLEMNFSSEITALQRRSAKCSNLVI